MLATLVLLTAGAVGIAVNQLAATWVIIPPSVLLAGFLALLRAAVRIDSGRLRRATHAAAPSAADRADLKPAGAGKPAQRSATTPQPGAALRAQPVWETAEPGWIDDLTPGWEPAAEIIDISGRVREQVYDQYSDAAERAVGD